MNVENKTEFVGSESESRITAILGAYAIQLLTPIPFWPGLPLANLGLAVLLILLLHRESSLRGYRTLVRIAVFSALLLVAAISKDTLVRVGLAAICLSLSQPPQPWLFRWFTCWWMYLLLFNLCAPVRYLVHFGSTLASALAWLATLGWLRPRPRFFFGPDISQIYFLLLWVTLFAVAHGFRQVRRSSAKTIVVALLCIIVELNLINSYYSDLNIQLLSFLNFLLLPAFFVWSLPRGDSPESVWRKLTRRLRFRTRVPTDSNTPA